MLVVATKIYSVSTSHMVGHGFGSRPGHTKDHPKNGTNCLPALHTCVRVGVLQCSQTIKKVGLCVELSMGTCT